MFCDLKGKKNDVLRMGSPIQMSPPALLKCLLSSLPRAATTCCRRGRHAASQRRLVVDLAGAATLVVLQTGVRHDALAVLQTTMERRWGLQWSTARGR